MSRTVIARPAIAPRQLRGSTSKKCEPGVLDGTGDDLKRIHSHICTVAYPVLEAAGEMPAAEIVESDPITLAVPKSTLS